MLADESMHMQIAALYASASPLVLTAVVAGCGALATAHYRALPVLSGTAPGAQASRREWPRVSIIVPARNEEHNLPVLLRSLEQLAYPHLDIVIVDDGSRDRTSAIAEEFSARGTGRFRVIHVDEPAAGWTGKNFACYTGALHSTGDWLLFTDADTEHAPDSLRVALGAALDAGTLVLSIFTRQRCRTFWERLLLPFAYQQYFVGVRPRALRQEHGPALANGQYVLIARDAYWKIGGHRAVAASIIDDVALAGALKRAGFAPLVCRGESLVRVRMYDGLGALVEGFTKNAFQFLREQRGAGLLVVLSTACAAGVLPAILGAVLGGSRPAMAVAVLGYATQVLGLSAWERTFGVPLRYALLAPVAALTFTGIALSSAWHALTRRPVPWKGRGYPAVSSKDSPAEVQEASDAR